MDCNTRWEKHHMMQDEQLYEPESAEELEAALPMLLVAFYAEMAEEQADLLRYENEGGQG
jgi:hypothetical protein